MSAEIPTRTLSSTTVSQDMNGVNRVSRPRLTPDKISKIRELWLAGYSGTEIAKILGVSVTSVYYHAKAMNLEVKRKNGGSISVTEAVNIVKERGVVFPCKEDKCIYRRLEKAYKLGLVKRSRLLTGKITSPRDVTDGRNYKIAYWVDEEKVVNYLTDLIFRVYANASSKNKTLIMLTLSYRVPYGIYKKVYEKVKQKLEENRNNILNLSLNVNFF